MTIGFEAYNTQGNFSVQATSISYVYMAKYAVTALGETTIDFTCVGWPLVFLDIPYNMPDDANPASTIYGDARSRWGAAVRKIESIGLNQWRAYCIINFGEGQYDSIQLFLRVFGRLRDNFPNGSGLNYGMQIFNPNDHTLSFDTGFKMLQLAGNTYDIEISLTDNTPNDNDRIDIYDTNITLPFDLRGKAICANVRGPVFQWYHTGSYIPYDASDEPVDTWDDYLFETLYYANNNILRARRVATDAGRQETQGSVVFYSANGNITYSRLAVIDTTQFP